MRTTCDGTALDSRERTSDHNLKLVAELSTIAAEKDCTPAQLAIAWVLAHAVVTIVGCEKRHHLEENVLSLQVQLTDDDLRRIEARLPEPMGDRMDGTGMRAVDV